MARQAVETDSATAFTFARGRYAHQVEEHDTAHPIAAAKVVPVGKALESTEPGHVSPVKAGLVKQASETDTASTTDARKRVLVGRADEHDSAGIIRAKARLYTAVQADMALPITPVKAQTIGRAIDMTLPRPIRAAKQQLVRTAAESAASWPIEANKSAFVGLAVEHSSGASIFVGASLVVVVGRADEITLAGRIGRVWPLLRVGRPRRSWAARLHARGAGGVQPISSLSREYVWLYVEGASGAEPVEVAFTVPGVEPAEGQWHDAEWSGRTLEGAHARVRVGPGPDAVALAEGTWQAWVRVTRPDIEPVLPSGLVPII
ncbi:hypothetical protein ACIBH1_45165 [Nonomuraea sp. NPDC050663]|uniref:hypothetical protein n=1 Tax=Nonomuraea sp. NPDC050663 TaxID=3364370 RepID=UPI00379B1C2B